MPTSEEYRAMLGAPVTTPAETGPEDFIRKYGPLAQETGRRLGVDPSVLLGQWGLETGWGKSVIPGSNNLGNIKDFSGGGVPATDNMTGSRDRYRQYASASDFGTDFAGLIERRYSDAIGAGADADTYAQALAAGGYAEDPAYPQKLAASVDLVRKQGAPAGLPQPPADMDSQLEAFSRSRLDLRAVKGGISPAKKETGSALGDVATGLKRGAMVEVPDWLGRAAKWFGAEDAGKKLTDFAEKNDPLYQESETGKAATGPLSVRGNLFEGASSFVPSQALPVTMGAGGFAVAGPPGALIGYGLGSFLQLPIFYGSAAQSSYETVKPNLIAKGMPEAQADLVAKRTANLEGAAEVGTEFAGDAAALLFGSKFSPSGQVAGGVVKNLLRPTLKAAAATGAKIMAAETGEEVANAALQPLIRQEVGQTGEGPTWDGVLSVIMPTIISTAPLGFLGGANNQFKKREMVKALQDPEADVTGRSYVAQLATKLIEDESPEVARGFALYAGDQISAGKPIAIEPDDFYLAYPEHRGEDTAATRYDEIRQKQIEHIQGQMEKLRVEAGVDQNNGDIYATPLGEQYQWLEGKLQALQSEQPAPEQDEMVGDGQEPDIAEPMRPFAERAMFGYPTPERAQTVADSMSKVQNGQYVVVSHPRMPGKFAVIPAENDITLPPRQPNLEPTQDEISQRLADAAAQAPDQSLEAQMQRAGADRALRAIEARGGVASPIEAQIVEQAGLGRPFDRIDPSLAPVEQQTQPREHTVYTPEQEARKAEKERLDAIARGEPVPAAPSDAEVATQRLEQAAQEAPAPRMDETEFRLRDAVEEGRTTAAPTTTPAGIILPDAAQREAEHPIPFAEPPAPVTIAGKPVREMSEGELKTYATSTKPDVAAKAKAELTARASQGGANSEQAPGVAASPFGRSWQTFRNATVSQNNALRTDVSERLDLGPDLSRRPLDYVKADAPMRTQINDAITDLVSMGMPEQWLWGVRNIATHTEAFGANVRARFSTHYLGSGQPVRGLSVQRSLLRQGSRDQTVPHQLRGVMAHEITHGIDHQNGQGYLSASSPLFEMRMNDSGKISAVGPVIQEVVDAFVGDWKARGPLADLFAYPLLAQGQDLSFYQSETFAQLGSLFTMNPALMQEKLPTAYALFKEIQNATQNLRPVAERPGIATYLGREAELGRAVQAAFRTLSESVGSPVQRGLRDGENDARVAGEREGAPGSRAVEGTEGSGGELLGSNQGYKDDGRPRRRPKNVADITDEEFEAEIKRIGGASGRIAGMKHGGTIKEVRAIAQKLEAFAKKGIAGKEWYEKSAYAILAAFNGNTYLAERFIQLVAITSSGTQVKANFTNAVKAWEQFAHDKPIHVATSDIDQKIADLLYFGREWDGRKTNTFYLNLTEAMYGRDSGFSTQDMHMGNLAFGSANPTNAQYELLENLTRMVANTKSLNMLPRQLQASAWVVQKAQHLFDYYRKRGFMKGMTDKELREHVAAEALINYGDLAASGRWVPTLNDRVKVTPDQVRPTIQTVTMETIPSSKTEDFQSIQGLPVADLTRYSKAILKAVPVERVAEMFGLSARTLRYAPSTGGYDSHISPNFIIEIAPEHVGQPMTEEEMNRVRAFARALMYVYRQDAVPFFRADPSLRPGEGTAQLGLRVVFQNDLTAARERKMFDRLREIFGDNAGFTQLEGNEVALINYRGEDSVPFLMEDAAFLEAAEKFAGEMAADNPITERETFGAESDYPYHNWEEDPDGADLLQFISAGRTGQPDLQARLRAGREEAQAASKAWIADYEQRIAGSNEEAGFTGGMGRGDVQGDRGGPRVSVRPQKPDGQEVVGTHFGKAGNLTELLGGYYGTGIKGAERDRLSFDPTIRPRVYFYLTPDTSVLPRPEPGLGSHVYRATLTNLYPIKEDPAGIFPAIKNIMDPGEKSNEMERRMIAAGYDGYMNKGVGMAVVLTNRGVKVEYLGQHDGRGGIRDVAGSNFAVAQDTTDETLSAFVKRQLEAAGTNGDMSLFPLGHARRVALFAADLGRAAGLNPQEISLLTTSAMLHDIGKVTLPEPILNKPGKLTDAERTVIEKHTTAAEKLLADQMQTIKEVAVEHHERWNGSGYPNHLAGEQISKYARIIAVADVFDALTSSDRPYKKAWTKEEALKQLHEWSGTYFEPSLVDKFDTIAGSNSAMPEWLAGMPQADQDAAKRAGVYLPTRTWQERLQGLRNGWKERVSQGMFDQFAPVKQLDERAYILDRMTKGADAGLEALLMYGKPVLNSAGALDVADLDKGGVIQLLSELNGEHDRFLGWIAGNRAFTLKQQGRENNLTDVDISALRLWNQGKTADGRDRTKLYADVQRRFQIFNKAVLDVAEKAGLIDGAERKNWEQDFYVPFFRVLEDQGYEGPRDVGSLVNQYAFKRLRGGKERLNDLFENTLRNWNHLLSAALKNQAAQATIGAAEKAGVAVPIAGREKGAVSVREQGKQRWYQIEDPLIMDAITSLEYAGIAGGPIMKMMQKAKHYLTFGVTLAPAFKIRNLIRDQVSAIAQNPISGNLPGNVIEGWKLTSKDKAQYAHMLAGGGLMRFGTSLEGNRSAHTDRLVKMAAAKTTANTPEKIRNLMEKVWDAYQELGDRSENVTRASVYRQVFDKAVADGKSQDEAHLLASFAARDSMDFGLQGSFPAIRLLSQLVPFFNARLQGLYKMGREGVAPTIRMLSGNAKLGDRAKAIRFNSMAFAVSAASVMLMLAQGDDDDWKAREDWDRDTYWWVKVGGTAYRIPKPFELGFIGSVAERGVEAMMRGMEPEDQKLFAQRLGWMLVQTFKFDPTPQLVKPLIDLYANTNSFTQRPIETAGMEKLSKAERIGPNTSMLAQVLGKAGDYTGLSPVQIDSLIDGYFSWLGATIVDAGDYLLRPAMGAPEKPARRIEDTPVIGSFVRELPAPQSRYVTLFYENSKRFGQLAADIQYYQKLGMEEKALELAEERQDDVALAKIYERVQRSMGEINAQVRRVQASTELSREEKREALDQLNERKNELARLVEEHRKEAQK